MERSVSFGNRLFDSSGRTGRLNFFLFWIVSGVLSIILIGIYTYTINYIRRWHDLGKSGWWTLVLLVPIVGLLAFLYLLLAPGEEDSNEWGSPS